ncbi:MAG TPA: hypothetical protein VFN24_11965 [Microbacterium sp.]|nr:hypothetical protein [Microbacterium sp.]
MLSVRTVLLALAFAFTAYLAVRGMLWTTPIESPVLVVSSLAVYVAGTWLCLLVAAPRSRALPRPAVEDPSVPGGPERLPWPATAAALFVALTVPSGIAIGVGAAARAEPFATWYIGGVGVLMTIVMVRRRPWAAWAGMVLLTVACSVWLGPLRALELGLVGSLMWVTAAQLLVSSFDRAVSDTARLAELQQAASAWQAVQAGRQRERRVQVQRALAVAGPVLTQVVRSGGELDDDGRVAARLAEGRLRDELRGPRLLDDEVRAALDAARRRGAVVTVLDEGGLDGVEPASLAVIRAELAETIRGAQSQRLYIRTSRHDRIAVTVVGRSVVDAADSGPMSDDDSVDLWREITYPAGRRT